MADRRLAPLPVCFDSPPSPVTLAPFEAISRFPYRLAWVHGATAPPPGPMGTTICPIFAFLHDDSSGCEGYPRPAAEASFPHAPGPLRGGVWLSASTEWPTAWGEPVAA